MFPQPMGLAQNRAAPVQLNQSAAWRDYVTRIWGMGAQHGARAGYPARCTRSSAGVVGFILFRSLRNGATRGSANVAGPFQRRRSVLLTPSVLSALLLLIAFGLTRWWPELPRIQGLGSASFGSCDIKGNISESGERIYHLPSNRYYDVTGIDESRGERWFCSEAEARAAGWRPAKV